MATLQELKVQIENANALGKQNLTDKGVEVEETATTYEIMQGIAEVVGGGGQQVRSEITCSKAGDVMFAGYFDSEDRTATKINDGLAIVGYCTRTSSNCYFACYVGETPESVEATNVKAVSGKSVFTIEYDGKTYYYSCTSSMNRNIDTKNAWCIGDYDEGYVNGSRFICNDLAVTRLLDYYYCKIGGTSKEEQEKTLDITENGTTEVLPDEGKVLSKVTVNVDVAGGGAEEDLFAYIMGANGLFLKAETFPSVTAINLPNVTNLYQAFAYWNTEPIPIVEELTVNAPKGNSLGQMFLFNHGVKKIILNVSDDATVINSAFQQTKKLEEIVLGFSTKNVTVFSDCFNGSTVKRIVGALDFSSATNINNMFVMSNDLEEVTFAPNTLYLSINLSYCSNLSATSVQSIIDGLATVETTQTLTLHKNIVLTDEQKATINAKRWTLVQ